MKRIMVIIFLVLVGSGSGAGWCGAGSLTRVLGQANQGVAEAQVQIGDMYARGKEVPRDYQVALAWYQKAADQGYADGQRSLGVLYELGQGVAKDLEKAAFWYEQAALQGVARAQVNLGSMYENGQGLPKDYGKAMFWYRKAAEQGYGRGMNHLALLYENGLGVKKDIKMAIHLYEKGAGIRYSRAMLNLGRLYEKGAEGVAQDLAAAVAWYRMAVDIGFAEAEEPLARALDLLAKQQAGKVALPAAGVTPQPEIFQGQEKEMPEAIARQPVRPTEVPQLMAPGDSGQPGEEKTAMGTAAGAADLISPELMEERPATVLGPGMVVALFVAAVVAIVLIFLAVFLGRRGGGGGMPGASLMIAELENEIKNIRSQVEELRSQLL